MARRQSIGNVLLANCYPKTEGTCVIVLACKGDDRARVWLNEIGAYSIQNLLSWTIYRFLVVFQSFVLFCSTSFRDKG